MATRRDPAGFRFRGTRRDDVVVPAHAGIRLLAIYFRDDRGFRFASAAAGAGASFHGACVAKRSAMKSTNARSGAGKRRRPG